MDHPKFCAHKWWEEVLTRSQKLDANKRVAALVPWAMRITAAAASSAAAESGGVGWSRMSFIEKRHGTRLAPVRSESLLMIKGKAWRDEWKKKEEARVQGLGGKQVPLCIFDMLESLTLEGCERAMDCYIDLTMDWEGPVEVEKDGPEEVEKDGPVQEDKSEGEEEEDEEDDEGGEGKEKEDEEDDGKASGEEDDEEHELDDEPAHPMVPEIYLEFEDRFQKDRFDVDPKDRWATEGDEGHGLLDMGKMMEGHRPVRRSQRVAKV